MVIALMLMKCNALPSGLCECVVNAVHSQLDQCECSVSAVYGRLDQCGCIAIMLCMAIKG